MIRSIEEHKNEDTVVSIQRVSLKKVSVVLMALFTSLDTSGSSRSDKQKKLKGSIKLSFKQWWGKRKKNGSNNTIGDPLTSSHRPAVFHGWELLDLKSITKHLLSQPTKLPKT